MLAAVRCGARSCASFPTRVITMIVPYPAGGPSDVVARIVADGMGRNAWADHRHRECRRRRRHASAPAAPPPRTPMATRCSAPAWDRTSRRRRSIRIFNYDLTQGFRADRPDRQRAGRDRRAQGFSCRQPQRIHRLSERERRQGASRRMAASARPRTWRACCSPRNSASSRAGRLSRHRAGDQRPHRRPCRFLLRAGRQRRAAR